MIDQPKHIAAFTILEVTIVVAIMSILITIISTTINRFNEQLKFSNDVHKELNQWFAFRSNLWGELYRADSMKMNLNELHIFDKGITTAYKIDGEELVRKKETDWTTTGMKAERISLDLEEGNTIFRCDFVWKGDVMTVEYLYKPEIRNEINAYFDQLK